VTAQSDDFSPLHRGSGAALQSLALAPMCHRLAALVLTLLVPVLTWDHFRQRAIRARADPFCPHCGGTLIGLPGEGRCPGCGAQYRDE
jgi:hypothetical protein